LKTSTARRGFVSLLAVLPFVGLSSGPRLNRPTITKFPHLIPFRWPQPTPWMVQVARLRVKSKNITSIARYWHEGDTARCQLCQTCAASFDSCLIMVPKYVAKEEAALYAYADLPVVSLSGGES
jgi:hypothetical protein